MAERTTREVIRAAIEEWALTWREGSDRGYVPMLETPLADLADRIITALTEAQAPPEDANEPFPDVSGVQMVRFLLEMSGKRQKDLVGIFGTESIVSEVLAGRRELQRKHIEGLSQLFGISPSAFFPRVTNQGFVGYLNTDEGHRRFPHGRFPRRPG